MEASGCPKYKDYRGVMIDIALEDTSLDEPALVDEVRRHIRVCPFCQHEFNGYRRVVTLFTPPPVSDEEIEEIAANVRRRVLAQVAAEGRRRRLLRWSVAVACVAALAAVAVGIAPLLSGRAARPTSTSQALEAKALPSVSPTTGLHAVVIPAKKEQPAPVIVTSKPITPEQRSKLDEAKRLREEGRRLVRARDLKKAEVPLRNAIQAMQALVAEVPGSEAATAALYEQYRCYELLGEHFHRDTCFEAYIGTMRSRDGVEGVARAIVEDARRLIAEGASDSACRRLESVLALHPRNQLAIAAHVLMGTAAEQKRLYDLASSQYDMALALGPPPALAARLYRSMISTSTRRGNFDAALKYAEALCALPEDGISPEDRVIHKWLLARLYARKGQTARATALLRDVAQKDAPERTELARAELRNMAEKAVDLIDVLK